MAERALPMTKLVKLEGGELSQVKTPPPWTIIALASLLLVGAAWWAVSGKQK